jgi:hypothetical protein
MPRKLKGYRLQLLALLLVLVKVEAQSKTRISTCNQQINECVNKRQFLCIIANFIVYLELILIPYRPIVIANAN